MWVYFPQGTGRLIWCPTTVCRRRRIVQHPALQKIGQILARKRRIKLLPKRWQRFALSLRHSRINFGALCRYCPCASQWVLFYKQGGLFSRILRQTWKRTRNSNPAVTAYETERVTRPLSATKSVWLYISDTYRQYVRDR